MALAFLPVSMLKAMPSYPSGELRTRCHVSGGRAGLRLVLVLAVAALATAARGMTLDVCQSHSATFASIQEAIDAASDGDVIEVCGGVHIEPSIFIHGKSLTIQGKGQHSTFIEPPVPGPVFSVFGPAQVTIQSLTVRNGENYNGGALEVVHGEALLADCSFVGNTAVDSGGAVSLDGGASLIVSNCVFEDNSAGLFGGAINARRAEDVIITSSIFIGNDAGDGGAVEISEVGGIVITGSGFLGNAAEFTGGALVVTDSESLILTRSAVSHNLAGRFAGIRLDDLGKRVFVESCKISDDSTEIGRPSASAASAVDGPATWPGRTLR